MEFPSGPADLVCLGDSITQKFEWQDAYPDWTVRNRGIGSDTTEGVLARLDSVVKLQPRTISLMIGINDLALHRSASDIEASYREILSQLQEALPDAQIIVTSVLPVTATHSIQASEILALNERLEVVCREEQVTYLNLFTAFSDEENCLRAEYALDDVHLTVQGYRLWLSALDEALS